MSLPSWGIALTTNASTKDVLEFCAYHLELGAHRIYLYLDDGNPKTFAAAKAHPKLRPRLADAAHWVKRGTRPERHQERQIRNINHAYKFEPDVDWLWHIDVDEFLCADEDIALILSRVPNDVASCHVLPLEYMWADAPQRARDNFRRAIPRRLNAFDILGIWGKFLPYGFLSHRQGKCAFRTGQADAEMLIHSAHIGGQSSWDYALAQAELLHIHVKDADDFIAHFQYRHAKGSYRAELTADNVHDDQAYNMHSLLGGLYAEGGDAALRMFYESFCTATPEMIRNLQKAGLLRQCDLALGAKRQRHFPDVSM